MLSENQGRKQLIIPYLKLTKHPIVMLIRSPRIKSQIIKNNPILTVDYSHLAEDEAISLCHEFRDLVIANNLKDVLLLIDITGTPSTPQIYNTIKEIGDQVNPYIKKRCVIGVEGVKKLILTFYNNVTSRGAIPVNSFNEGIEELTRTSDLNSHKSFSGNYRQTSIC